VRAKKSPGGFDVPHAAVHKNLSRGGTNVEFF